MKVSRLIKLYAMKYLFNEISKAKTIEDFESRINGVNTSVLGELLSIPETGLNITYEVSEFAGTYSVKFTPIPQSAITAINSEGASLYWGGRFDFNGNWKGSHVCHREGEEMDIGLSNFIGAFGAEKRELLNNYLTEIGERFYYPVAHESPNPVPNDEEPVTHWHIRLKK